MKTFWLVFVVSVLSAGALAQNRPAIDHGVAAGDATSTSAVIWSRTTREAAMMVRAFPAEGGPEEWSEAPALPENDFAASAVLDELSPNTQYRYEVTFVDRAGRISLAAGGRFRTAPLKDARELISFVVSGDLGGQQYCRDVETGYAIFDAMGALEPDFFVANGDLIYVDNDCPEARPGGGSNIPGDFPAIADPTVLWTNRDVLNAVYRGHWRYNRADVKHQAFLRNTVLYAQWDDHEVINDFGAAWEVYPPQPERNGYPALAEAGRKNFFDYNPIARNRREPNRIYRSFRWGKHLELFLLDARSYRSKNALADTPENEKTMLGEGQLKWIIESVTESDATWKIISNDVPMSVPTGSDPATFGRDGYANGTADDYSAETGFERELKTMLRHFDEEKVRNLVFVTTDVHFPMEARYENDFNDDGDALVFHEIVSGPLSAFRMPSPISVDPTFNPEVVYAEGNLFNFSYLRLESTGPNLAPRIAIDIRDETGTVRPGSELTIEAH